MNPKSQNTWFGISLGNALLMLVVLVTIYFTIERLDPVPYSLKKDFNGGGFIGHVGQLITSLVLLSLLVERGIEVFVAIWWGKLQNKLNSDINKLQKALGLEQTEFQPVKLLEDIQHSDINISKTLGLNPPTLETQSVSSTTSEEALKQQLQNQLIKHESYQGLLRLRIKNFAVWTAWLTGLCLSLAGIRMLEWLFVPASIALPVPPIQESIFHFLDILLTGSLIAGGSDGIHRVFKVFNNFSTTLATRAQDV